MQPQTTARLNIAPLDTTDASFIFELLNSEGWLKFIGDRNVHSENDAVAYIQKIMANLKCQYWVFRIQETNTPIGIITLIKRDHFEHPDIGFAMLPQYENLGYTFEASKHILNKLLKNRAYSQIIAITLKDNVKSIRLLEKLGLTFGKIVKDGEEELMLYSISLA